MKKMLLCFVLLLMGAAQTALSQTGLDPSFAVRGISQLRGDGRQMIRNKSGSIIVRGGLYPYNNPPNQLGYKLDRNGLLRVNSFYNGIILHDTFEFMVLDGIDGILPTRNDYFVSYTDLSDETGRLALFDSLGHVDYNYGQGGVAYLPAISSAILNTDSQDRVLYAGQCYGCGGGTMGHFVLYRYLPNGTIDSSFAANGRLEEATTQYAADVHSVEQTPNGKILLGEKEWMTSWSAYRYLDDGRPDSSFGGNGRVSIFWRKAFSFTRVQPDKKVLLIGYDADSVVVVRVNEDGSWDSSYGNNGIAKAAKGLIEHAVVRPDGRLVLGGNREWHDSTFVIWQMLPDGRIDTSFGQSGQLTLQVTNAVHTMTGLALQPDGKIIMGGQAGGLAVVARFFADGRLAVQEPEFPESSVQLYPNPTGDVLKVSYPALREKGSLTVYDITGRVMQNTPLSAGSSQTELRVRAFIPGTYILEVKTSSVRVQKRFLKQ